MLILMLMLILNADADAGAGADVDADGADVFFARQEGHAKAVKPGPSNAGLLGRKLRPRCKNTLLRLGPTARDLTLT